MNGCTWWILMVWIRIVHENRALSQLPEPYCPNFTCNDVVYPGEIDFSEKRPYKPGGQTFLLPVGADFNTTNVAKDCLPALSYRSSNWATAVFAHGYCKGDSLRPLRDAIVAKNRSDALQLIKTTKGRLGVTHPQNYGDFYSVKCVDAMGYEAKIIDGVRPETCFSLLLVERQKDENQFVHFFTSGWLSLNRIPFERFHGLGEFVMNGNISNENIGEDLICKEYYYQSWVSSVSESCSTLTYPGHYYRICCCYREFGHCRVHTNPLSKPEPARASYRCLQGKYDSKLGLEIVRNTVSYAEYGGLAQHCTIEYHLYTNDQQLRYAFTQRQSHGSWFSEFERGPYAFALIDDVKYYCLPTQPANCPLEAKPKLATHYGVVCHCRGDYCNRDHLSVYIETLYRNEGKLCNNSDTLMDMLQTGRQKCHYFIDLWNLKYYSMGLSGTLRIIYNSTREIAENVTLVEFKINNGCMQPNLPIRGFAYHQCDYPEHGCLSPAVILDEHGPRCVSSHSAHSAITDLEALMRVVNVTISNSTFRCFARANFVKYSHRIASLDAGAVDDLSLDEMNKCINATLQKDCHTFQEKIAQHEDRIWVCCRFPMDPRHLLRAAVHTAALPKTAAEIRPYFANITVCIIAWRSNEGVESKCLTEVNGESEDAHLYQFCANHQNRRQCSRQTDMTAFCCCGDSLNGCELDPTKWGEKLSHYLESNG